MKQYKAVFSDIDGTLLNTENKVTRRTLEAIRALGPLLSFPREARRQSGRSLNKTALAARSSHTAAG
mgnify:CR=1 FL=1